MTSLRVLAERRLRMAESLACRLPACHPARLATQGSMPCRGLLHLYPVRDAHQKFCHNGRNSLCTRSNIFDSRTSLAPLSHRRGLWTQPGSSLFADCENNRTAPAFSICQRFRSRGPNEIHSKRWPNAASRNMSPASKKFLLPVSVSNPGADVAPVHSQSDGVKPTERYFLLSPKGIVQASPEFLKPYLQLMRFDRPIGTWLLFLPSAFSISMATPAGQLPDPVMLSLFALGAFFMRGAGCTINDMWDKDFDAKVARTMDRPLACGKLSYFQALSFLGIQLSASLAILLTFNWNTVALGAASLIPCVIYPLMKRITYWPQAFLGFTFNYGVLMGWCAATGGLDLGVVLPLYTAGIAWTLVYDTIYGHQDKEDDMLVGVKSTALKFGDDTKPWLTGFTAVTVTGLAGSGLVCGQTWPFYVGVAATALHLIYQVRSVDLNNPDDCGRKFRSNRNLGIALWLAIIAGTYLKEKKEDSSQSIVKS